MQEAVEVEDFIKIDSYINDKYFIAETYTNINFDDSNKRKVKLQLSLVEEDFKEHQGAIENLMIDFLKKLPIQVKVIKMESLEEIDHIDTTLYITGATPQITFPLNRELQEKISNFGLKVPSNSKECEELRNEIKLLFQYKNSNQYSITFSNKLENENLIKICQDIENFCISKELTPGETKKSFSIPITTFISIAYWNSSNKNNSDSYSTETQPELEILRNSGEYTLLKNAFDCSYADNHWGENILLNPKNNTFSPCTWIINVLTSYSPAFLFIIGAAAGIIVLGLITSGVAVPVIAAGITLGFAAISVGLGFSTFCIKPKPQRIKQEDNNYGTIFDQEDLETTFYMKDQ